MKKKVIFITTLLAVTILITSTVLAGVYSSPAEIVSSLSGKNLDEIYAEHLEDKTYGEIAEENGVYDEFRSEMFEYKKQLIDQKVKDGLISEENAEILENALQERMANCAGNPGLNKQKLKIGFGKSQCNCKGLGYGMGQGIETGKGK